jgi:hypothetical protein
VLTFARNLGTNKNDLDLLPVRIAVDLGANKVSQVVVHLLKELGSRSDGVGVKVIACLL